MKFVDVRNARHVRVAREQDERPARRDPPQLVGGVAGELRLVHHHDVHVAEQRPQPVAEGLALSGVGGRLVRALEALAGLPLERVGVAGHAQAAGRAPPPARSRRRRAARPRCVSTMPPASAIRRTSASESWLPETNTNGCPIRHDPPHQVELERRAARGEVADEEERPGAHGAVQRRQREQVVVEVRGDHRAPQLAPRLPRRRRGDQLREPHELLVQLLRDRLRRALRALDRPERHGDVRPVRVVLGVGDLAARREEQEQRQHAR